MHLLKVIFAFADLLIAADISERRLIVSRTEGPPARPSFIVSIQSIDRLTKKPKHICTGSLISKHAILTAAHCLHHLPVSEIVVTLGLGADSPVIAVEVFNVASVSHPGYHYQHFASVNDIALLFLDRCVEPRIEFPQLASGRSSVERSCAQASTYGFGRHEIIPPDLFVPDGQLRALSRNQHFHTFEVCREAFSQYTLETLYKSSPASPTVKTLIADSINSNIGCYGGDQRAQASGYTCEGDSGGPVFDTGANTLVGVTSFSSEVCGTLPNYFTRVGPFSRWIYDEIKESRLTCANDNDMEYLVASPRKLEQSNVYGHPLLKLITRAVTESCASPMTQLNNAVQDPTVPTADIQRVCSAFLICLEEATATPAIDVTSALLSMFPTEVDDIAEPLFTKQSISRILLCSSAYESFYENWHLEANITFSSNESLFTRLISVCTVHAKKIDKRKMVNKDLVEGRIGFLNTLTGFRVEVPALHDERLGDVVKTRLLRYNLNALVYHFSFMGRRLDLNTTFAESKIPLTIADYSDLHVRPEAATILMIFPPEAFLCDNV